MWDEQVRDAGRAAFLASGLAHAGDVWTRLEPRIGDYAHAWRVAVGPAKKAVFEATYTIRMPSKLELVGGNRRE